MSADAKAAAGQGLDWLSGGGEMGKLIRALDWAKTPLGPVERWPQSLRTTVSLCLSSTFPILIAWGPERVQLYNDSYRPICGEKHPESMGQRFNDCWASALPAVGHVVDRAQGGDGSYIENLRMFLDRYGYLEEAWMTFSFSPIRDESGGVGGLFHPITEVTDKMLGGRRTQALQELAGALGDAKSIRDIGRRLAAAMPAYELDVPFLLFYQLDGDGQRLKLLDAWGLPKGAAPEELPVSSESAWPLGRALASGHVETVEQLRFPGPTCGPYPEAPRTAMLLPLFAPGESQATGCLVAGVSARRALDASYRAFYEQLRNTVTSAVSNVRAYEHEQARAEALAEVDRAKTTFFSNVSHEFRTPLTLMLGPLESLLASGLPEEANAELSRVQRNGLRLLKLVNTLLDFSRIEAGRLQAAYEPVDLAALTVDLASTFRSLLEKAELKLVLGCPPLSEPVWVDREMYEKIVLNLLSNAFKFTFQGEVRVTLRAREGGVELSVADTGTGIPAEELPRLFERFHRVEGSKGRSYEGSGIGLALVQELVKLHGGNIQVASAIGRGTAFTVFIPSGHAHLPQDRLREARKQAVAGANAYVSEAAHWSDADVQPRAGRSAPRTEPALSVSGGHILVADDNADMRDYVTRLLKKRFSVEGVSDGYAALEAARARAPDLVLSDVMMPRLDGFGLLRELRADTRTAHVPVILLSARAGEEATIEGLNAGANDYLVKPFSAQELLARVEGTVRTAQARQDLDAFAGRIAHDLRNLLAPVPLVAAQVKLGDERFRKAGERLERLTRRAHNLLDGMLAFSRTGFVQEGSETTSLSSVVVDVMEDLSGLREQVDAEMDVNEVEDAAVALPRGLLYVVLLNLLQNALKFITGRPQRRVKLVARTSGSVCEMRIADTGPGIGAEPLPHIFEPFYRAPGSKASGYGIGLATVQRIVRSAGGDVGVSSVPGEGTTFTVRLPAR